MVLQIEFQHIPANKLSRSTTPIENAANIDTVTLVKRVLLADIITKEEDEHCIDSGRKAVPELQQAKRDLTSEILSKKNQRDIRETRGQGLTGKQPTGLISTPKQSTYHFVETSPLNGTFTYVSSKMNPARLFIASLGNPPPYSATRHSAGHVMLKALQSHLQLPPFLKSKPYAHGLTSFGADVGRSEFTLWQSPSLMNVSGVGLLKAYKQFTTTAQLSPTDPLPGLIVIYDEMEKSPSQLHLRKGNTSAKGHNGLKSVQQSLQAAGLMGKLGDRFVKIGVGIGRPTGGSRSSDDVSRYVLGQLTSGEKDAIDAKASELLVLLELELQRLNK